MPSKRFLRPEQLGLVFDVPGLLAGVDEAGRGPLAGPVVAAAVILDDLKPIRGLNDSKVLTPRARVLPISNWRCGELNASLKSCKPWASTSRSFRSNRMATPI